MGKHGGKAHTPVMLDDNLKSKQFYRVLDLVSEGPIWGPVDQTNISSFLVNNTPITDEQGNSNINGITVAWREGSENQDPIKGMSYIESTTMVNLDVKQPTPIVRTITDPEVTRVRFNVGVSSLMEQTTKGDQKNTTAQMVIETRLPGGSWINQKTVNITGKISGEYLEAHVIAAPDTKPFDIRVSRVTPDSVTDLLSNGTVWNSYTEIIDDNLSYPFSAICGAIIDHDQYSDTPNRTYHLRGLIVDVPDNYNPLTRTYTGLWTGGFKQEWTNNPAWLFRELVKNNRFGLARRAGYIDVDDGSLYILSQYADQLVDDGYGGKEPRLTLNAYITDHTTARELLDKIAGMFRGMALWDGMRLTVLLDNPADPIAAITNANVVEGKFTYSSTKRDERFNAVVVSWCDPNNGWKQSKEYVSDDALIARYGYNETTMEAFGCTSRGQAWRAGKWLLETAKLETKKVRFQMAREAIAFMPGDIVEVMDNQYAAARLGGRILAAAGAVLTLDAAVDKLVKTGDNIALMNASGKLTHYKIQSVAGDKVTLQTTPPFVKVGSVFVISASAVASRLFRIMGIEETENNSIYTINAAQHDPHKQAIVDDGAIFETPTDTLNGFRVPDVENLKIVPTNSETVQVTATWETATTTRGLHFEVIVYSAAGDRVVSRHDTDQFSYAFYGLPAGSYELGVRGINAEGMKGAETVVTMNIGAPAKPTSVRWDKGIFSATIVPLMGANATSDTTFEFWYGGEAAATSNSTITDETNYLGRANQWSLHGLKADTTYYMYVRSRNAFGVSDFVMVSGEASGDIPGMIQFVDDAVRASDEFAQLSKGIKDVNDDLAVIQTNIDDTNDAIDQVKKDMAAADANLQTSIQGFASQIATVEQEVTDSNSLIADTKRDLEASIAAITGGGNTTITTMLNDIQRLKTADSDQLKTITGMTTRMDGIDGTIANQQSLWRADDKVVADRLDEVSAKTDENASNLTTLISLTSDAVSSVGSRIDEMLSTTGSSDDRKALLTTIQKTESDADASMAQNITSLGTQLGTVSANVTAETKARSDAITQVADRIDKIFTGGTDHTALVNNITSATSSAFLSAAQNASRIEGIVGSNTTAITNEAKVRADADTALSTRITTLNSTVGGYSSRISTLENAVTSTSTGSLASQISQLNTNFTNTNSQLIAEQLVRSDADTALGQRITAMTATTGSGNDKRALLTLIQSTTSTADAQMASQISTLQTTTGDHTTKITNLEKAVSSPDTSTASRLTALETASTSVAGRIATIETSGAKPDSATNSRITTVESKATAAASAINSVSARVSTIETSGAKPDAATTSRITTLESGINGIGATVQTQVSTSVNAATGVASGQWGVKVTAGSNNTTVVAGIQLGLTSKPGDSGYKQSNFIVSADTFSIYNTLDGTSTIAFSAVKGQVFIKSALIQNGSIDMLKIADKIESTNFASVGGWQLNKNGQFIMKGANTGQRIEITKTGIKIYDSGGNLRVALGQY
ncbi:DUF1983 domain-containing protein [Escherichia coli]|nr:DUF1983 domain-containing protein [Escherichia coli]